ncbi:MAG: type II secretion system F family protein [Planctomycetes bacterium]|nr:type II secretion system F family protein [Planctomycetota bacterium]
MSTISIEQLAALNDEIAALVKGGMPLELGLREMQHDSAGALQEITGALAGRLQQGASLAEALEAEKLPVVYRQVVSAGLRAGRLPAALEAVSGYAREMIELRRQVVLAMMYPLIVTLLAYVLFVCFVAHVVERFRETYEIFRIPVPWMLQLTADVAQGLSNWWWVCPLLFLGLIVWWVASGGAQVLAFRGLTQPLAWFPYVGTISLYFRHANFSDLLALLVEHQVPLPEGLRLVGGASADPRLEGASLELADALERGQLLDAYWGRKAGWPPFLFWVLAAGQRQSELPRLLRHAAAIYRRQALTLSRWFRTIFPIVAAIAIGGTVTVVYAFTLFGSLAQFWMDLGTP